MSLTKLSVLTVGCCLITATLYAQARDAGQIVVPRGYENVDSFRIGLFDIARTASDCIGGPGTRRDSLVNLMADSLQATMEFSWWGGLVSKGDTLYGKRKMVEFDGAGPICDLTRGIKQRYYYALPYPLPTWMQGPPPTPSYFWKYNAANFDTDVKWYDNTYDANEISPYTEYPANDSLVKATYHTSRFKTDSSIVDSVLAYGDDGKPILAYSDDRLAASLLRTDSLSALSRPDGSLDVAHDFSTTLEFNIDTSNIDTANLDGRSLDDLPLLRLQVLFKQGDQPAHDTVLALDGWPVQPFTPFRDAAHANTSGAGWYRVTDVIVTKRLYRALDSCWRKQDWLENGSLTHPGWNFKQLHVLFQDIPQAMKNLMIANKTVTDANGVHSGPDVDWGGPDVGWGSPSDTTRMWSETQADSIVSYADHKADNLLEFRIFSTYRAKIRVRGLAFEDTIADKFFYRKRLSAVSTHSLNPIDITMGKGEVGGLDDAVDSLFAYIAPDEGGPGEFGLNDTDSPIGGTNSTMSHAMMGYMDYMGAKRRCAPHYREQEGDGASVAHFRRNRLGYDGKPPSLFANQSGIFWSGNVPFPRDYVALAPMPSDTTYDSTRPFKHYNLQGMLILTDSGSGDLAGYKYYSNVIRGLRIGSAILPGTRAALHHPPDRRMAYEYSLIGGFPGAGASWAWMPDSGTLELKHGSFDTVRHFSPSSRYARYMHTVFNYTDTISDTIYIIHLTAVKWFDTTAGPRYATRPETPEEISGVFFTCVAAGVSAIDQCQPLDYAFLFLPWKDGIGPRFSFSKQGAEGIPGGLFGMDYMRTGSDVQNYDHYRNFGHEYTSNADSQTWTLPDTNDINGNLPYFYLGYANSWRAWARASDRINQIYDSTNGRKSPHPLRRMTWLDGYANAMTHPGELRVVSFPQDGYNGSFISPGDSIARNMAFLKIDSTVLVKRWSRARGTGPFTDSVDSGRLVKDDDTASYVQVGLFKDSTGYAAMVVNTRTYPCHDSIDSVYYNSGLALKDQMKPLLGDIDVRKLYMKLDLTKTDPTFGAWNYYVVRDLWHPDSTWLLHRDSTFAVYIKPGDAKFLYFEPDISVNAAARTGTDIGKTRLAEFCFNNGRRVAERLGGTHSVVTYTRNNKLYVSYPAAGATFGGSPDASSGDNILTGNEQALDTSHFCARPSICPASNDTAVALAYWYRTNGDTGKIVAGFQRAPDSVWQFATFNTLTFYDSTSDFHWVTPVLTPVNDTTWLVAAGYHSPAFSGAIQGRLFVTPRSGTPYFKTGLSQPPLAFDTTIGGVKYPALFPTLASRPIADSLWPIRFAFQRPTKPNHHEIFYGRRQHVMDTAVSDTMFCVSRGLAACDNVHPSLAFGAVMQKEVLFKRWYLVTIVDSVCFDDHLTWEAKIQNASLNTGSNYWPIVRARHEHEIPTHRPGFWGAYCVEKLDVGWHGFHYPVVATEPRYFDYSNWFDQSAKDVHDFIRVGYQNKGKVLLLAWAPDWLISYIPQPYGALPSLAQSTTPMSPWRDSAMVPRSFVMLKNASDTGVQSVKITNGWLNGIDWLTGIDGHIIVYNGSKDTASCSGIIGDVLVNKGRTIPSNPSYDPQAVGVVRMDPTQYGVDDDWPSPPRVASEIQTNEFAVHPGDSIIVARKIVTIDTLAIQSALSGSSDYLTFRVRLMHYRDSIPIVTIDSMAITRAEVLWAGTGSPFSSSFDPDSIRYQLPGSISDDSAFLSFELLRGDVQDTLERSYLEVYSIDTVNDGPAAKRSSQRPEAVPNPQPIMLTVHPNPAQDHVLICVDALSAGEPFVAEVVSVTGEHIATLYDATPEADFGLCYRLDCSHLATGIYYVRVANSTQGRTVKFEVVR
ncbi:MAG: hypothetical protein Q8902_07565 [Bacteroidota bacterium]|nr:hypothetical protein [Bacteroidota bacterium]MDP4232846.1 hypothetical protein [Bacteroidota bacterium]MDP4241890.1 hypothetical protein [Bacteroidota bacterium]